MAKGGAQMTLAKIRAAAKAKGYKLVKGSKMALSKQNRYKVKVVIKGLSKASKTHAGQAKTLKKAVGMSKGGSTVNKAGNYTKPTMRKTYSTRLWIKAGGKGGAPGQWSARKAQMLAKQYKAKGGGYR